MKDMTDIHV